MKASTLPFRNKRAPSETSSMVNFREASVELVPNSNQESIMAKGNRSQKKEVRKPKKEKPKAAPATSRRG